MKKYLTRLLVVAVLAAAGWWLWSNRHRVADLSNFNVRIQGNWYKVEMDFANTDIYNFSETFISINGQEWASYKLLPRSRIEISSPGKVDVYHLSFPDDDNMVWSISKDNKLVPTMRWRR
ncbi:MAG: hypothetical protein PVG92_07620 [Holophagae bacterium]|jgi:hypothetical protein